MASAEAVRLTRTNMSEALDTGLRVRHKVPLILQSEVSECGLASLAMCLGAHGRVVTLPTLRTRHPASSRGMTLAQMTDVAQAEGMELLAFEVGAEALEEIRLPAILHWESNHYVVLVTVKHGRWVTINDPAVGARTISWSDFCIAYSGIAAEVLPTAQFQRVTEKSRVSLWSLLATVPSYKSLVTKLFLLAFMLEMAVLLAPLFLQNVVDQVLPARDAKLLFTLAASFCGIALIRVAATLSRNWTSMALTGYMTAGMKGAVFSHALRLPVAWFDKRGVSTVLSRFNSLNRVRDIAGNDIVLATIDLVLALLMLGVMFLYAPLLALVSSVVALVLVAVSVAVQAPYTRAVNESIAADAQEAGVLIESISGVAAVKFFGTENFQRRSYLAAVLRSSNRLLDLHRLGILLRTAQGALTALEEIVIVSLAGYMVMSGKLTLGMMFGYYAYKQIFSVKLTALVSAFMNVRELKLHAENVGDVTFAEPEETPSQPLQTSGKPSLSFENIDFAYEGAEDYLLRNFSLHVQPGEIVGVTGASGGGKSTLVKILLGALKPTAGVVRIDGVNVTGKAPGNYRPLMSVVMQSDSLFTGTLLQNITMFEERPDTARAEQAVLDAQFERDVQQFPMGLNSTVSGINPTLSGGQRQRLLLARAFYKNAPILILDEATSALDATKEIGVAEAIRRKGLTTLIVAHREETLRRCDRVVVLGDAAET